MMPAHLCLSLGPYVHVLSVGPEIEALTGLRPDDFLSGRVTLAGRLHPEDQATVRALLAPDLDPPQGSVTLRLRQAGGQVRRVKAAYRKVRALGDIVLLDLQLHDAGEVIAAQDSPRTIAGTPAAAPVASPPKGGDALALLSDIPGLDVATGVRLLAGHSALYLRLLRKFIDGQADAPARIDSGIARGDWDGAERTAHTLKGVSAQIGAGEVRLAAEQLEHAMRRREPAARLDELQAQLAATLAGLIDALKAGLPEAPR